MNEQLMKEMEEKMASLDSALISANATIASLNATVEKLTADLTTSKETINKLDKALTIAEANKKSAESKNEADAIIAESFSTTSLSEALQTKIKGWVKHENYLSEDGTLNKEAFKAAFTAEVKDMEANVKSSSQGIGHVEHKTEENGDIETDMAYGRELARKTAGTIRSDEK